MLDIVASYHCIMVSYHHAQYQQKLMIQSWENLATDRQIDRGTEKSDFIGHCSTNVERLIINMEHISNSFCLLDPPLLYALLFLPLANLFLLVFIS